jgi:hypothetical protein
MDFELALDSIVPLSDRRERYFWTVTATGQSTAAIFDTFDGELQTVAIEDDTATVIGRFPETVDSTAVIRAIRERYPDIELVARRRLLTPTYLRQFAEEIPTDRRRSALRLAYFGGYYEQPRLKTGDELAAALGIPRRTSHYHLRRAESTVFYSRILYELGLSDPTKIVSAVISSSILKKSCSSPRSMKITSPLSTSYVSSPARIFPDPEMM